MTFLLLKLTFLPSFQAVPVYFHLYAFAPSSWHHILDLYPGSQILSFAKVYLMVPPPSVRFSLNSLTHFLLFTQCHTFDPSSICSLGSCLYYAMHVTLSL